MIVILISLFFSSLTTWILIHLLSRSGVLDQPGERKMHEVSKPRGGGWVIVISALAGLTFLLFRGEITRASAVGSGMALTVVALVGWLDDLYSLSWRKRLAAHLLASVLWLVPSYYASGNDLTWWILNLHFVLGITAMINFVNFMDGIDGIIGALATSVLLTLHVLLRDSEPGQATFAVIVVGACLGFLVWNWAPSKIFLGDVGSGSLGLLIAGLASRTHEVGSLSIPAGIVLVALLALEPMFVLILRKKRRLKLTEGHRQHPYQVLARRWHSHGKVAILYTGLQILVLAPLVIWLRDESFLTQVVVATVVSGGVIILVAITDSGRRELSR